jgi:ppGpp synthetase/RelA/SpoT-type nucleotidyltranferase
MSARTGPKIGKKRDLQAQVEQLDNDYRAVSPVASRLVEEISRQMSRLLEDNGITPGVPIQGRVKTWSSILEKIERKALTISSVRDLPDLVGLRVILQFTRDLQVVCRLIEENFTILERNNTEERLQSDQFGYSSIHFIVELPKEWAKVPTFAQLTDLRAEIQVRTMAQHIWAAASHTLQYKREASVPIPVRRAISRVSALLETVDLEFERVLASRDAYREQLDISISQAPLNVDLLEKLMDSVLPAENKNAVHEDYGQLLGELRDFGITDSAGFMDLYEKDVAHEFDTVLSPNAKMIRNDPRVNPKRVGGVPYYHVGLVRQGLRHRFGKKYVTYQRQLEERWLEELGEVEEE